MADDPNTLIQEYEFLWQKQANFRMLWNTAAQFVMPAWDNFIGEFAEGVNRNTRIFDSTGITANERFAAAMKSMLTPDSQIWHKIKAGDKRLNDDPAVKRWCDEANEILFFARYHPEANFASQTDECYMSLGAYGNDLLFVDEAVGTCLRYRCLPLSELVWSPNHQGAVDSVYRKFKYTAKQAVDHWGLEKVPQQVKNRYRQSKFDEDDYLHVVKPNKDHRPGAYGDEGKRFISVYLHLGTKQVLERGGYRCFPFGVGRYRVAPRENYGRGPATTCLPDIRTANEMVKTNLRTGQKMVDPPILLAEESILANFNQRPGANNYGMLTADGKPLAQPFKIEGQPEVMKDLITDTRNVIRDAFLNTLFQILVENPNMTATEALLRAQEKGELIAPAMGRQHSEFLGQVVRREIDILWEGNQFPPVPDALRRSPKGLVLEWTSPLARALRAEEGSAIMNTIQDLGVIAQLDPTVRTVIDTHGAIRAMAEIRGMPAKLVRSEEEADAILQQLQQQQQEQQAVAAAPQISQSALNLAKAQQAATSAPAAGAPAAAGP